MDNEKCSECGSNEYPKYVHCSHCLKQNAPSGLMTVSFDVDWWYVHCGNCDILVTKFARVVK